MKRSQIPDWLHSWLHNAWIRSLHTAERWRCMHVASCASHAWPWWVTVYKVLLHAVVPVLQFFILINDITRINFQHPPAWQNNYPYMTLYKCICNTIQIQLVLHWSICNVLPQFNVSGINSSLLCNDVLIQWCWLLLLLFAGYCQGVKVLTFLPHSNIVVYHSTNHCSSDEWNSNGDNCCNSNTGGTWAGGASCIGRNVLAECIDPINWCIICT